MTNYSGNTLFSIVIPTYNHANFICRCLDSLLAQTYSNWEAIIVNNYSEDNTIELVSAYKDSRIHIINFRNSGIIGASRNIGIQNASGNWICFLDSDDWWSPDKLEICLEFLQEFDLLYHDMTIINDTYKKQGVLKGRSVNRKMPFEDMLLKGNPCINSSIVIRREILKKVGNISEDKSLIGVEDFDYWLRASKNKTKFKHIKRNLGFYWVCESSISFSEKQIERMDSLYALHIKDIESEKLQIEISKRKAYRQARIYQQLGLNDLAYPKFLIAIFSRELYTSFRALLFMTLILIKRHVS
jgi:glycosyltransferase involved in cell wall biosynthesis